MTYKDAGEAARRIVMEQADADRRGVCPPWSGYHVDVARAYLDQAKRIEELEAALVTAGREALEEKLIDDAEEGLRGMVYQESDSGKWHPSYQDWIDLKEYVEPVLKLIAALRAPKEKPHG